MNIFILVDKSGSMDGEPIKKVHGFIDNILDSLRRNSVTLETAKVCIIEYGLDAVMTLPLTNIKDVNYLTNTTCAGPKNLGIALELANKSIQEANLSCLFIFTKGKPSDPMLYNIESSKCRFENIYILHGNIEKSSIYNNLSKRIISWDIFDGETIIRKIYGGQAIIDSEGNELLQAPPSMIEIII